MPTSTMKVKSGAKYPVKYKVSGEITSLTSEQRDLLALRQLRNSARAYVLAKLQEAEPAIAKNIEFRTMMLNFPNNTSTPEELDAYLATKGLILKVPTEFEVDIQSLVPTESSRGKKAADLFSYEGEEDDDEGEETTENN